MAATISPFVHTATGVLGDKRDSMLVNQLHLRSELGKSMTRGYMSYPGKEGRYGKPNISVDGGAGEALTGWTATSLPYLTCRGGVNGQQDFIAMNRAAVDAGLTSATDQANYRTSHDMKVRSSDSYNGKGLSRRLPPTMVFGVATRPGSPVMKLIEHRYQEEWLKEQKSFDLQQQQSAQRELEEKKRNAKKVSETRASLLRTYKVPVEQGPLWQMPKFRNRAKPALQTFRSSSARERSFALHQTDSVGRKGVIGQGLYQSAKS